MGAAASGETWERCNMSDCPVNVVITGLCLLSCTMCKKMQKGFFLCYHLYLHIWEPTSWRLRITTEGFFCKLWTCRIIYGKRWFTAESESPKQISWEFLQLSCVWYHYLYCFCVYNVFWGMVHIFFCGLWEPKKDIKKLRNFFHKYDDEKSVTKVSRFHRNRRRRLLTFFHDRLTSQQEVHWQ